MGQGRYTLRSINDPVYPLFVCRWQVKPCNPLVTHGPYLSALAKVLPHNKALYKSPDYIRHVVIMIIMNIIIIMFIIMMLVITIC